jgi:hypothetical protein
MLVLSRQPVLARDSSGISRHPGGQAAVVAPVSDFLCLRALEQAASAQELEDVEDKAALADWRSREAAGQTSYVPHDEALRRLGLAG